MERQPRRLALSFSAAPLAGRRKERVMSRETTEICFESNGTQLFAYEAGDGPAIVLLHGGLANHLACWRFAAPLAERFRVIMPDVRASGRSHFAGDLTWHQLAGDVAALLRHLGLPRAVIGGVSSGSGVAMAVALHHPALVAGLVALTPAFGGASVGLTAAQAAAMQAMDAAGRRAVAEGVEALYPLLAALPAEMQERARAMFATYDLPSVAATTRFLASGGQPFADARELAAITAPALVVPGTDPTHPPEIAELYARHLPRATVRAADPAGYAAAIGDFIAGL
jgi:pimeloyl-ACP methyl ester carboxylesterase